MDERKTSANSNQLSGSPVKLPVSDNVSMPLIDVFGRVHRSLRISVTDRCNLRCFYCMPETGAEFAPREKLLTFEEIERLVSLLVDRCGIHSVRITGGEPLVRRDLDRLIKMLAALDRLDDLSLTTNGLLLAEQAERLRDSGLRRLNISLDTVDEATFLRISRRKGIDQVISGIDAALRVGFDSIKLNTTAMKGITQTEIVDLVRFAIERDVELRFIEFMALDTDRAWQKADVLSGDEIRAIIESHFGKLTERDRPHASQPAESFQLSGGARIGLIRSVSVPFCNACDRLRLTADGAIRNCLFAQNEFPIRDKMRGGASDEELLDVIVTAVSAKAAGHGMNDVFFSPPDRPMYSIGG
ncbi:GTP 3',8-cyclase MoaA [Stieleria varia]|uniref:GTP 3',8-cyclase MoaA n=1 Tax=Stieleria varia TaxID=2528005 RepID=UPI001E398A4A|nr:GTP 3',8-cyclase MoaA [Stieleria varia]